MSMRLERAASAVVVLLPSIAASLSSQADTQAASVLAPAATVVPMPPHAAGEADWEAKDYQMSAIYDRVTNRTRLTIIPAQKYQAAMDRASVSIAVSVTYPGRGLTTVPDSVEFLFTAWAPARMGWALGHAGTLKLMLEDSLPVQIPSTSYQRLPVSFTASGRTEMVVFRVATPQVTALAASSKGKLKVGRFTIKLDAHGLEGLQTFARRLTSAQQ